MNNAIATAATDRDIALSVFSDVFKEINGWRPRGLFDFTGATVEDIEAETARLIAAAEAHCRADAVCRAEAFDAAPLTDRPFARLLG